MEVSFSTIMVIAFSVIIISYSFYAIILLLKLIKTLRALLQSVKNLKDDVNEEKVNDLIEKLMDFRPYSLIMNLVMPKIAGELKEFVPFLRECHKLINDNQRISLVAKKDIEFLLLLNYIKPKVEKSPIAEKVVSIPAIKRLSHYKKEAFAIILMKGDEFIFPSNTINIGQQYMVDFPQILMVKELCDKHMVNRVIALHNHPPYWFLFNLHLPYPSDSDIIGTKRFQEMLYNQGVEVYDHLIVCKNGEYFSFREHGLI
jgi:hypothetical protein